MLRGEPMTVCGIGIWKRARSTTRRAGKGCWATGTETSGRGQTSGSAGCIRTTFPVCRQPLRRTAGATRHNLIVSTACIVKTARIAGC